MTPSPPSTYTANLQTLVNSLSFQTSVTEPPQPLNLTEISTNLLFASTNNKKSKRQWLSIFPGAAFFKGYDHKIEDIIVMVYEDLSTKMISTVVFTVLGEFCFNGLKLSESSRFFAAVENLKAKHQSSNVRRAIAISLLKMYSLLNKSKIDFSSMTSSTTSSSNNNNHEWDEMIAGELASNMKTITGIDPLDMGKLLMSRGFLQASYIDCSLLDVVYNDDPDLIPLNNKIVYQLGEQLDKLFDPLTEYSPESTGTLYLPPRTVSADKEEDDEDIHAICDELLHFQERITTQQIRFLTKVITPLREKSLKGKIPIKISELNEIFPPTIDEVTRMNCILLDALKIAIKYGSFEMVKACGVTVPYFFKAYMRHEAALKTFSSRLKEFLSNHEDLLPSEYRREHVESVLHASLNLLKLKLVLERLIDTKDWDIVEKPLILQYFAKSVDIIDLFGKTTVPVYDRRVFTPSGKLLTEICEGWPSELSYGWLRRKVVSVLESKHLDTGENGVIIMFSDYVVFAAVKPSNNTDLSDVKISDIIMNSLINEEQLAFIPSLKVTSYSSLQNLQLYTFDGKKIRTVVLNKPSMTATYELEDSNKFLTLFNKAKILGKTTPFHLFKDEKFGFSVAHEIQAYVNEAIRSKVAMFLNTQVEESFLMEFDLFAALFVSFEEDERLVTVHCISSDNQEFKEVVETTELSQFVFEKLSQLESRRNASVSDDLFDSTIASNKITLSSLLDLSKCGNNFVPITKLSPQAKVNQENKPLPKVKGLSKPNPEVKMVAGPIEDEKRVETEAESNSKLQGTTVSKPEPVGSNSVHEKIEPKFEIATTAPKKETEDNTLKRKSSLSRVMEDLGLKTPQKTPPIPKKDTIVLKLSDGVKHTSYLNNNPHSKKKTNWKLKPINFNSSDDENDEGGGDQGRFAVDDRALRDFEATMMPLYNIEEMGVNWGTTGLARVNESPVRNN